MPRVINSATRIRRPRSKAGQSIPPRQIARTGIGVLPTLFTLGNLLCGGAAIFVASRPTSVHLPFDWTPLTLAAVFILGGMILDGLDGSIARITRSYSSLGEQLDSMADMVTFGVAPAFVAVQLVDIGTPLVDIGTPFFSDKGDTIFGRITLIIAAIYVVCAALRLARFNIELIHGGNASHNRFNGLPSPGAAGTVASLVLLHQYYELHRSEHWSVGVAEIGMVLTMLLTAFAMVSRFHYVHVINRYVRGHAPFRTIVKIVIVALLLIVRPQESLAVAFVTFALSAPVLSLYEKTGR